MQAGIEGKVSPFVSAGSSSVHVSGPASAGSSVQAGMEGNLSGPVSAGSSSVHAVEGLKVEATVILTSKVHKAKTHQASGGLQFLLKQAAAVRACTLVKVPSSLTEELGQG